jgi:hypothetical protein
MAASSSYSSPAFNIESQPCGEKRNKLMQSASAAASAAWRAGIIGGGSVVAPALSSARIIYSLLLAYVYQLTRYRSSASMTNGWRESRKLTSWRGGNR